ncbi:uncharacterized protein BDR25DRAFT_350248 [Lindgomyces ingoldianus]|uniref:Uncharacterized protein n=1 Tax=Lindgomyces ingoldianus TaxID=673940 RepID=A0ACB6RB64_9PLEO|nr:uncharacterized protein BDR25DRAFT_350248 [Lindgomyces ingoldianus]KAF2475960.1 hypothetical protein BDR25DRAFT_350248 [Lindgomyces ingoldianus]
MPQALPRDPSARPWAHDIPLLKDSSINTVLCPLLRFMFPGHSALTIVLTSEWRESLSLLWENDAKGATDGDCHQEPSRKALAALLVGGANDRPRSKSAQDLYETEFALIG